MNFWNTAKIIGLGILLIVLGLIGSTQDDGTQNTQSENSTSSSSSSSGNDAAFKNIK